jgi:hypothetical protein
MPPGLDADAAAAAAPLLGAAPPPSPVLAAGAPRAAGGILRDKHGQLRSWADQRARTTALVYLAGTLERINEQVKTRRPVQPAAQQILLFTARQIMPTRTLQSKRPGPPLAL